MHIYFSNLLIFYSRCRYIGDIRITRRRRLASKKKRDTNPSLDPIHLSSYGMWFYRVSFNTVSYCVLK